MSQTMSRWLKDFGPVLVAAIIGASGIAIYVADAQASAKVSPVAERVSRVEERQAAADKDLDDVSRDIREMRTDVKEILRALGRQ